jgi:long-chain acyl-CoA synthetase
MSVGRLFLDRVAASPSRPALVYPKGEDWETLTWAQVGERASAIAGGLLALGIQPEQRVAIASSTRVEWLLVDLGVMCAGAATTTVYPSTPDADVAYILGNSGSRLVFAEDQAQADKVLACRGQLPDVIGVVLFDGQGDGGFVMGLSEFEALGEEHLDAHPSAIEDAVAAVGLDCLATLIYTSGTTGRPKGVRLVHDNWLYEAEAVEKLGLLTEDDVQYLCLPLAHVFGKVLIAAQLRIGFSMAVDGRVDKIGENLPVVRPTFVAAVPRIFERVHARVAAMAEESGGPRHAIFNWAFGVGRRVAKLRQQGTQPKGLLALQYQLADRLVFSRIRARFGDRLRYFVSGSARLDPDIAEWFLAAGIVILEGYGLTETSGFTFVNRPDDLKFGTVGPPAPGTEVRIAEDGEILVRGRGVMRGYHEMPEETEAALTDGWFHTGDIGELEDSRLRITDRKKDLFKTSGGKYVAPQVIEALFKATCPLASQIVVHGEGRKFCSALITLDPDAVAAFAARHGITAASYEEIVSTPTVRETVQNCVDAMNQQLARWEAIRKFWILSRDLSVEAGEVTPSLKVKRRVVERMHMKELDALYA